MIIVHPLYDQITSILLKHGYQDPSGGLRVYKLSFAIKWMGQDDINKYQDIYDLMNVILRLKYPKYKGRIEDNKGNAFVIENPNIRQSVISALQKKVLDMLPVRDTPNYLFLKDYVSGINGDSKYWEFLIERYIYEKYAEIENLEEIDTVKFREDIKEAYDYIIENGYSVESNTNNAYYDWMLYNYSLTHSQVFDKKTKKITSPIQDEAIRGLCMTLFKIKEIGTQDELDNHLREFEKKTGFYWGNIGALQILQEYEGTMDWNNVKIGAPEDLMLRELYKKVNGKKFPENHKCSKRMAAQYIHYCLNGEEMIAPEGKITQQEALIINDLLGLFGYYDTKDSDFLSNNDIYNRIKYYFKYDKTKKRYTAVY